MYILLTGILLYTFNIHLLNIARFGGRLIRVLNSSCRNRIRILDAESGGSSAATLEMSLSPAVNTGAGATAARKPRARGALGPVFTHVLQ